MKTDLQLIKSTRENLEWFVENSKQIQEEFGGKAVAIYGKKIIASANNGMQLREQLRNRGIDDSEVIIERIPMKGEIRIF